MAELRQAIPDLNFPPAEEQPPPSPPPPPTTTTTATTTRPPLITLQVNSTRFTTTAATLSASPMLAAKLRDDWASSERQPDGSYHLDADPETFAHILRFLRDGIYPLAYDIERGHDFLLYTRVRCLAEFLLVDKLVVWLREKRYLKAVRVETSARVVKEEDGDVGFGRGKGGDGGGMEDVGTKVRYFPTWRVVKRYVCPRRIHNDNRAGCGRQCLRAQGDREDEYEDCNVLSTLVVKEKVVFDERVCVEQD
ncbi:MAG: hypothetical protein L6R37_005751 [Teloschistes peruensis]|nr:MAG: hypothetical protein L6R37_005751 [Teloschistes peruensis]